MVSGSQVGTAVRLTIPQGIHTRGTGTCHLVHYTHLHPCIEWHVRAVTCTYIPMHRHNPSHIPTGILLGFCNFSRKHEGYWACPVHRATEWLCLLLKLEKTQLSMLSSLALFLLKLQKKCCKIQYMHTPMSWHAHAPIRPCTSDLPMHWNTSHTFACWRSVWVLTLPPAPPRQWCSSTWWGLGTRPLCWWPFGSWSTGSGLDRKPASGNKRLTITTQCYVYVLGHWEHGNQLAYPALTLYYGTAPITSKT